MIPSQSWFLNRYLADILFPSLKQNQPREHVQIKPHPQFSIPTHLPHECHSPWKKTSPIFSISSTRFEIVDPDFYITRIWNLKPEWYIRRQWSCTLVEFDWSSRFPDLHSFHSFVDQLILRFSFSFSFSCLRERRHTNTLNRTSFGSLFLTTSAEICKPQGNTSFPIEDLIFNQDPLRSVSF